MRDMRTACGRMPLWKWSLLFIAGFFLFIVIYSLSQVAGFAVPDLNLRILANLLVGGALLGLYAAWTRLAEHRWPAELKGRGMARNLGVGMGLGVGMFCAITGILAAAGMYRVESVGMSVQMLLLQFSFYFVIAAGEEIIFRGIIFRMIDERFSTWAALLISALIFGFVHIFNENATVWSSVAIAIEAGLMLGLAYKYSGGLWMPIGIHWTWNFTQGNIFGFGVSGHVDDYSLITPAVSGPDILTGGTFGPEASVIAAALGLAISFAFLAAIRRSDNRQTA